MYEKKIPPAVFCPIDHALRLLGGKWKSRIVCVLAQMAPLRYGDLKREMANVTDTALSNALREMERDGLLVRRQYNEVPLRVEYTLSAKGEQAVPLLLALADWANGDVPLEARRGDMALCLQCRYHEEAPLKKS